MTPREILAYAITHAPKGVKGGPYESWGREAGESCRALAAAYRTEHQDMAEEIAADARNAGAKHARVIRIVRKARPFKETIPVCGTCGYDAHGGRDEESEPAPSPSEAVEVLRELVAWSAAPALHSSDVLRIADRARRVLAASGPDPMPVVRAAMAWRAVDRDVGSKDGRTWRERMDRAANALAKEADEYEKAGGAP